MTGKIIRISAEQTIKLSSYKYSDRQGQALGWNMHYGGHHQHWTCAVEASISIEHALWRPASALNMHSGGQHQHWTSPDEASISIEQALWWPASALNLYVLWIEKSERCFIMYFKSGQRYNKRFILLKKKKICRLCIL